MPVMNLTAGSPFWLGAAYCHRHIGCRQFHKVVAPAFCPGAKRGSFMTISAVTLTPLVSLIAGVLILVMPRLLNYIVAIYLIIIGLVGLFPHLAG